MVPLDNGTCQRWATYAPTRGSSRIECSSLNHLHTSANHFKEEIKGHWPCFSFYTRSTSWWRMLGDQTAQFKEKVQNIHFPWAFATGCLGSSYMIFKPWNHPLMVQLYKIKKWYKEGKVYVHIYLSSSIRPGTHSIINGKATRFKLTKPFFEEALYLN